MSTMQPKTKHALKNGYPTIAVLMGSLGSEYQESILRGAAYAAEEKNYNIIAYSGGAMNSSNFFTLGRETVFRLVDCDLISGVLSPFGSILRYVEKQQAREFIEQFSSVPIVNIGYHMQGYTNIISDYEPGFIELFEHFYHHHGYRKILLLRGPKNHISSDTRMHLYQKQLHKYGIPFDDDMVIYSDLNKESAQDEMNSFLAKYEHFDKSALPFDAIIALNDGQAIGATEALKSYDIRVPQDVALSGSLNTLEASFFSPSITSVQEPNFELGYVAALELISQIEGNKAKDHTSVSSSLVLRESCGCTQESTQKLHNVSSLNVNKTLSLKSDDSIFIGLQQELQNIAGKYKAGIIKEEVERLLKLYTKGLDNKNLDEFTVKIKDIFKAVSKSNDVGLWLLFMSKVQFSTLQYLKINPESPHLIKLSEDLIEIRHEASQVSINFQRYETEYYLNYFRAVTNNFNSSFDLSSVNNYTADILNLSELYISIFNEKKTDFYNVTNIASVHNEKFIEVREKKFSANQLIPNGIKGYKERYSLIVLPLSFRSQPLGFMTVNLSNRKGTAFENLRAIISAALQNELLIQNVIKAEKRFSDIAHSTSNWLWETDSTHQFIYSSESSKNIIGYSEEELTGRTVDDFVIENRDEIKLINLMASQEVFSTREHWFKHQSGEIVCLLISAKPIFNKGKFAGYRGVFEDITEEKRQAEKIKHLAYTDVLTGLPNRTLFQATLSETILDSSLCRKKFALLFLDLDHFKNTNDSMGHAAGDLLLIKVVERLKRSIPKQSMLARLGGDEFTIILSDIDNHDDVVVVVQNIFRNMKEPIVIYGKSIYMTLSLGISIYPDDAEDSQILLKHGDSAMYHAKSQGRNGYAFYDKGIDERHTLRYMYEGVLRTAIENDGFILNYQPQVSVTSGEIVGFEVLVRILDNDNNIVAPNNFIPLAEELGLIGYVDEWVFEHSCKQYAIWQKNGFNIGNLSINLSAVQLSHSLVLKRYIKILKRYNIDPSNLQLEITENALIDNEDTALEILTGFKEYGISIALDDFGTGHSSLKCISLYPIDTIKIDRSFIIDAISNEKNRAIIQSITLIARALNLKVIAEGVEIEEQYELVKQLGCDVIQGYYFYKPTTTEGTEAILANQHYLDRTKLM